MSWGRPRNTAPVPAKLVQHKLSPLANQPVWRRLETFRRMLSAQEFEAGLDGPDGKVIRCLGLRQGKRGFLNAILEIADDLSDTKILTLSISRQPGGVIEKDTHG